jgi:hypothetical protein
MADCALPVIEGRRNPGVLSRPAADFVSLRSLAGADRDIAALRASIVRLARPTHEPQSRWPRGKERGAFRWGLFTIPSFGESGSPRYEAGETVFAEGTKTGRLLILKSGAVRSTTALVVAWNCTASQPDAQQSTYRDPAATF